MQLIGFSAEASLFRDDLFRRNISSGTTHAVVIERVTAALSLRTVPHDPLGYCPPPCRFECSGVGFPRCRCVCAQYEM